jgi:hypothetical protein
MIARIFVIACLLFAWQIAPAGAANSPPPDHTTLGYDISWPQCGTDFPAPLAFAIIGVNGGRPHTTNPCLADQLTWAAGSSHPAKGARVALYVNTANPGPTGNPWWPTSNFHRGAPISNPYGVCRGGDTAACAYIFGYVMAYDDVNRRGVPDAAHHMWWLDVETGNSWSSNRGANAADLEGMAAYLQGIGAEVGIYSTGYQFREIAGTVGPVSSLYRLKNWVAGATSKASARAYCSSPPLTAGGTVTLTQFTAGSYDYNYPCSPLPSKQPTPPPKRQDPPNSPRVLSPMRFF